MYVSKGSEMFTQNESEIPKEHTLDMFTHVTPIGESCLLGSMLVRAI